MAGLAAGGRFGAIRQAKTDTPDGHDVNRYSGLAKLRPESHDRRMDQADIAMIDIAPAGGKQVIERQDAARLVGQGDEKPEFATREMHGVPAPRDLSAPEVNEQSISNEPRVPVFARRFLDGAGLANCSQEFRERGGSHDDDIAPEFPQERIVNTRGIANKDNHRIGGQAHLPSHAGGKLRYNLARGTDIETGHAAQTLRWSRRAGLPGSIPNALSACL